MKTTTALFALILSLPLCLIADGQEEAAFSRAELDQMLAPIALYPDSLLAQILTASTYPLEVVEAGRWSRANPEMRGAEAVEAVADRDWDPSVQALVAFPEVIQRMDEDLEWTRRLGDAFLLQEEEMMAAIQDLREKAYAAGSLESLEHLTVRREREVIVIEPADPQVIYVPYYRPTVVYGSWWWHAYPPVYWGPPPTYYSVYYSTGRTRVVWSSGTIIHYGFFFSTFDWPRRQIVVVNHHHHHYHDSKSSVAHRPASRRDWSQYSSGDRWRHEPTHRRGVTYRTDSLNERYGRTTASTRGERSERRDPSFSIRPPATRVQGSEPTEPASWSDAAAARREERAGRSTGGMTARTERQGPSSYRTEERTRTYPSARPSSGTSAETRSIRQVNTPPRTITLPTPQPASSAATAGPAPAQPRQVTPAATPSSGASLGRAPAPASRPSPAAERPQGRPVRAAERAPRLQPEQRAERAENRSASPSPISQGDWRRNARSAAQQRQQ